MESIKRNIILVGGLPGCGKTTWSKAKSKELNYIFIDDIQSLDQIHKHNGQNMIICDPYLSVKNFQQRATELFQKLNYTIKWVMFTLDVEASIANDKKRNRDLKSEKFIKLLAQTYHVPEGAEIIETYKS